MYTVIAFSFVWDIIYEMKFSSLFEGIVGMSVVWSKTGCSNNSLSSQELRVLVRKKKCRVQSHKAEWLLGRGTGKEAKRVHPSLVLSLESPKSCGKLKSTNKQLQDLKWADMIF